ncbi:twin transmembrane helix small protein [Rhodobacteraceae bacterium NNCM2]|nr:twin transmembrane helix small protein [Coraliihabitans acroporae]
MSETVFYAAILFCFVTVAVLLIGVIGFGTGLTSSSTSNKLMRMRILFQFLAVCAILLAVWLAGEGS